MGEGKHKPLTGDLLKQVETICIQFDRAWLQGPPPSIETAIAGVDSFILATLLQQLVELDIRCRVRRRANVDPDAYLTRWPDLDRAALSAALKAAQNVEVTSLFQIKAAVASEGSTSSHPTCSLADFLGRLRTSRVLPDSEVDLLTHSASPDCSSAAFGKTLVEARKLTSFQVTSLLEGRVDPLVLGEYVVQELTGRGGMGTVYRAIHRRMKRTVAIKVLRRDIPHAELLSKRFLREVEVAARLCHPNVVTAYDAGEQSGVSFLVSEFVEGQNLSDLVRQYGPLSLPLAVDIVQQAARALEYAHGEGVIHRDIKPSNLLLDDNGNVKLLDVGLARVNPSELSDPDEASDLTTTGMIMGTVDYMSPEQALNTRLADERSDIYSLGCTLYFLITGRAPFASGTAMERLLAHREQPIPLFSSLSTSFPQELDDLLSSMLAKDSSQRIESMTELVKRLEALKSSDLPDITLVSSTIANELPPDATGAMEFRPTEAIPELFTSEEMTAITAFQSRAVGTSNIAASEPTTTFVASKKLASSSQASILPWIILPGLAAIVFMVWYIGPPRNATMEKSLDAASGAPIVESLTDMSEEAAVSYRSQWASWLGLDTEQTLNGVTFLFVPPGKFLLASVKRPSRPRFCNRSI